MSTTTLDRPGQDEVEYPDSDGQPMADNTLQYQWIVTLQGNIDLLFADDPNVFVAGDLLWYPVEGKPTVRTAPDVLVAFGRPKGYRGSYRQWREGGVAPQVVFEVLSPGNRAREMASKLDFYERYGVEEYYVYDPDTFAFTAWMRDGGRLRPADAVNGWTSPRLRIRFELPEHGELQVFNPDGSPFRTMIEMGKALWAAESTGHRLDRVEQSLRRMDQAIDTLAQRADAERQRAEAERRRAEAFAEKLRALGVDPDAIGEG